MPPFGPFEGNAEPPVQEGTNVPGPEAHETGTFHNQEHLLKIETFKANNGQFCLRLVAPNGRIIAVGGEGYSKDGNVQRAAVKLQSLLKDEVPIAALHKEKVDPRKATLERAAKKAAPAAKKAAPAAKKAAPAAKKAAPAAKKATKR